MKTILYLLFAGLFVFQNAPAQNRMHYGVKAGGGVSTYEERNRAHSNPNGYYPVYKWRSSFYGGFCASTTFGKFFFQPELLYSLRGYRYQSSTKGTRYGYISMPLLIGYKPIKQLGIVAGPELGYIITARSPFTMSGNSNTVKYIDYRNTIDLDAGLAWYVTKEISVEGRFVYSIQPLYKAGFDTGGFAYNKDGYNKVIQFGINYWFR